MSLPAYLLDDFHEALEKGLPGVYKFHLLNTDYFCNEINYALAKSYFPEADDLTEGQKQRIERKVAAKSGGKTATPSVHDVSGAKLHSGGTMSRMTPV
jgi:hypothetical protein